MVDVAYMKVHILDKCVGCFLVYGNDNLFARGSLGSHIESRLGFALATINDLLNLIDLVILEFRKHLFDLESVYYCIGVLGFR